jgi:hypothetical protein
MSRGVGYCENVSCERYLKTTFVMNQERYWCALCRGEGFVEKETFTYSNRYPVLREVRMEFDFDPLVRKYTQIAIVSDGELHSKCSTLTIKSPLCRTEKRGLTLAGMYFAYITMHGVDNVPLQGMTRQNVIDWDEPLESVQKKCKEVSEQWAKAAEVRAMGLKDA